MRDINLGKHLIIDYQQCPARMLDDVEPVKALIHGLAKVIDTPVLQEGYHHFSPYGVTGFAVVSASHIAVHTWPEYGYMGIDIFSCKELCLDEVFRFLAEQLGSDSFRYHCLERTASLPDVETRADESVFGCSKEVDIDAELGFDANQMGAKTNK